MSDLLNPDLQSLRDYMNDPDMPPGIEQDWEIIITSDTTAEYLLTLAVEDTIRHKELVGLLYLYTEAVLRNWVCCSEDALKSRLLGLPGNAPDDVERWKSESMRALADPDVIKRRPHRFGDYFFAEYFGHGRIF